MTEPWSPEHAVTINRATSIIQKQFPQLQPVRVTNLGEGFDNSVFRVNNQYVFRFPRREIAANLMRTECRILPSIAPKMPIPIPNPLFLGMAEGDYPWPFAGYALLRGKTPTALTEEQRIQSAKPLALFLKKLHGFPLKKAEELQIPYDQLGRMDVVKRKPILEANLEKATRLLDSDLVDKLQQFFSTINAPFGDKALTLVHGDLHFKNLLVDDNGQLSAVIDWGDTHIGHPAVDLSIVYGFLPASGRNEFFHWYGEIKPEWKTTAKFKAMYTLIMLLLYADDQEDRELVNECGATLHLALD
ncbi:phosphotransferase [Neobacillus sp. Marseille-QA0830]